MPKNPMKIVSVLILLFLSLPLAAQNQAPVLAATGQGTHCRNFASPIVQTFTITDPDDTAIDALYIQITTNYTAGEDLLSLTGSHPNIAASWSQQEGKLSLTGIGGPALYTDLIAAVFDVRYTNSNLSASGTRTFSITIGQANYLPSTGHYYRYVAQENITWPQARNAAQASTYYGLQGYLATLASAEEAQLAGEQASGTGWIGASDAEEEGVWKWVTGPEAGQTFWNGGPNGTAIGFAFWNAGEPNNANDEDYAHITFPGIGLPGSWNDLRPTAETTGAYRALGYVIEYGGTPGDPTLQIATSTTINLPEFPVVANASVCGSDSVTLQSTTANTFWFATSTGGTPLATGSSFTTPELTATTTYYVSPFNGACTNVPRIPVTVTVLAEPQITAAAVFTVCERETVTLTAQAPVGTVRWYDSETSTTVLTEGDYTISNVIANATYYVAAWNGTCSSTRIPVQLNVIDVPEDTTFNQTICQGDDTVLQASLGSSYLWSTGSTARQIRVSQAGTFSVVITLPTGCSYEERFEVTANPIPDIPILGFTDNILQLSIPNAPDFEYSLDNFNFQTATEFALGRGGEYVLYIRDLARCQVHEFPFVWLRAPRFFSPNGDSFNDLWTVEGMVFYPESKVRIFNKYGKLLYELSAQNPSWDGTISQNPLPASDYWFEATFGTRSLPIRGHFSLVR